jgi:hypothetical protein
MPPPKSHTVDKTDKAQESGKRKGKVLKKIKGWV